MISVGIAPANVYAPPKVKLPVRVVVPVFLIELLSCADTADITPCMYERSVGADPQNMNVLLQELVKPISPKC